MKYLPFAFLLCFIFSCKNKQQENQKNIIGTWEHANFRVKLSGKTLLIPPSWFDNMISGLRFDANQQLENKDGYFTYQRPPLYLGNSSRYKITTDSLFIYDKSEQKWSAFKLLRLNQDTLAFGNTEGINTFLRFKPDTAQRIQFDTIILSSSGCYGLCPVMNLLISRNGNVQYNGLFHTKNEGHFTSTISTQLYRQLQDRFTLLNLANLNERYAAGHTDDEVITISFIKNGRVYKSISDYGHEAPAPLRWAYLILRHLPDTLPFKPKPQQPKYLSQYDNFRSSHLIKNNMILDIMQSETFYLFQYLNAGKRSADAFSPKYKLMLGYEMPPIATDGRYFQLTANGQKFTIDVGFNFFERNLKDRKWRLKIEND